MYSIRMSSIFLKVIVFVLMLFTSGAASAAPENMETASTVPAILLLPITDSTGVKDQHDYMLKAINAQGWPQEDRK